MTRVVSFEAQWDDEAKVWWTVCSSQEGIVTEAPTIEALRARLRVIVPDFFDGTDEQTGSYRIELIAKSVDIVAAN